MTRMQVFARLFMGLCAGALSLLAGVTAFAGEAQSSSPEAVYIVVLNDVRADLPFDATPFGATQLARAGRRVALRLPEAAVEGLRRNPRVRYLQRTGEGDRQATSSAATVIEESALTSQEVATQSGTTWTTGTYAYDPSGNISSIGRNGTIVDSTVGAVDTFTYDGAGRLMSSTVHASAVVASDAYAYDGFGNLTSKVTDGATTAYPTDPLTNRYVPAMGVMYDGVGNVAIDNLGRSYRYDAVGMVRSKSDELYIYTADDERIGTSYQQEVQTAWRWTIRDLNQTVVREYESFGGDLATEHFLWIEDHYYAGTQLLAADREAAEGGRRHFHTDHLGTPRFVTNASGQVLSAHTYRPFGVEITSARQERDRGYDRDEPARFTGHERDGINDTVNPSVGAVDYMHARYYNPYWGRFLSVDPGGWDKHRPQTWNRYTYAENNPILKVDPDGRQAAVPFPGVGPMPPVGPALYHAQQMRTNPSYRRDAVAIVRTLQGASLAMLTGILSVARPFLVTPSGVILPGGKDVNLVPTAQGATNGTPWVQIHDAHDDAKGGGRPHTHVPETHVGPNGKVDVKRVPHRTTEADIDNADKEVMDGNLRPRRDRNDKGDPPQPKPEPQVEPIP